MKTIKNLIKRSFMLLSFALITYSIISCSKDDDPVDSDFFAGTYRGSVSYTDGNTSIENANDGTVFVTKFASETKYNFRFSDGIPNLNGIEFTRDGDHTLISIGATEAIYIRIDNNELRMLYIKDGETWRANATR